MEYAFYDFPREEYRLRQGRAIAAMKEQGLDALLVSDDVNVRYLTGYIPPTKNRVGAVLLTKEGAVALLADAFGATVAHFTTWEREGIRVYDTPFTYGALQAAFADLGLQKSTVGAELYDTFFNGFRPAIQQGMMDKLRDEHPGLKLVNACDLIWKLRLIKTPAEVEAVRKASEITSLAYRDLFEKVRGGITERDVGTILIEGMMRHGADQPFRGRKGPCAFVVLDTGRQNGAPPIPIDDKKLEPGNILRIDTGAVWHGYCSDFARSGTAGPATTAQKAEFQEVQDGVNSAIEGIRPGKPLGSISVHWHGVGMEHVEAPFRTVGGEHSQIIIEENMILSVEDFRVSPRGEYLHSEHTLVVTADGTEILSKYPEKLYEFPL